MREISKVVDKNTGYASHRYFENRVFVALNSGELVIYKNEPNNNGWQIPNPHRMNVSVSGSGLICMTAVAGRVWCGCQHQVILVNATTLKIEVSTFYFFEFCSPLILVRVLTKIKVLSFGVDQN